MKPCPAEARIVGLEKALSDLLTGVDVHNERVAGRMGIVPRIKGPVVSIARSVLKGDM
jgi:endonuclease III